VAIVKIGDRVTISPSAVTGFEASFTRNYSPYDVKVDGKIVRGDAAIKAVYTSPRPKGSNSNLLPLLAFPYSTSSLRAGDAE
jgi:hypothetical protein